MGQVDIVVLYPIYRKCIELTKENNWPWSWKEDSGDYETMIEFLQTEKGSVPMHPPEAKDWDDMKLKGSIPICPDIMDYQHRIVLEFEEESTAGKRGGKLGRKGHWSESKKDLRRDNLYKFTNFRFCKIWQSEVKKKTWINKLFHFLADCYCQRDTTLYLDMYLKDHELLTAIKKRK